MGYEAFISYSHVADGQLAPAVQAGLQRFAKRRWRSSGLRVFRDETGLAVNPHMWQAITRALDESAWFVLLASPESAASPWVARELNYWLSNKSIDRILPVLTSGTLDWDADRRDFTTDSVSLPDALRGKFAGAPFYLDLTWAHGRSDVKLRNPRFRSAVATLAAPIHGTSKEALVATDARERRLQRTLASLTALASVLLVVGVANARGSDGNASATSAHALRPYQLPIAQYPDGVKVSELWKFSLGSRRELRSTIKVVNPRAAPVAHALDVVVPKGIAASVDDVRFGTRPSSIVSADPIARYCLTLGPHEQRTLAYAATPAVRAGNAVKRLARWAADWQHTVETELTGSSGVPCEGAQPSAAPTLDTSRAGIVTSGSGVASGKDGSKQSPTSNRGSSAQDRPDAVTPASSPSGSAAPVATVPTPTTTGASIVTTPTTQGSTTVEIYNWDAKPHTRGGVDLKQTVGPNGWVQQPFVPNHLHLDSFTFVAGCGGCSVDVHVYDRHGGTVCIVRQLAVNENVFTTATFNQGGDTNCSFSPASYYDIQIFNLSAQRDLTVYLADDRGGNPADFAESSWSGIPSQTVIRSIIRAKS